jgi:hypothetical protein
MRVMHTKFSIKERVRPPAVPPRFRHFARVFSKKRLELKSLKGQTKTEELRGPCPKLLSLCLPLKAL